MRFGTACSGAVGANMIADHPVVADHDEYSGDEGDHVEQEDEDCLAYQVAPAQDAPPSRRRRRQCINEKIWQDCLSQLLKVMQIHRWQ